MPIRAYCLKQAEDCDEMAEMAASEESRLGWEADAADWRTAAEQVRPLPLK